MVTLTTNLNLNKPEVASVIDQDIWGGQLNTNSDTLDDIIPTNTVPQTANFTVTTNVNTVYLINASSSAVTATLPAASSVYNGFKVGFKATDVSNTVTIDGNGSETIDGVASITIGTANDCIVLICDGTNWQQYANFNESGVTETELTSTARVYTQQQNAGIQTLTDATNISWNLNPEQVAVVTLSGNRTLDNPTNIVDGGTYILRVIQDGTGSRTLSFGSAYNFPEGEAPVLTTDANAIDYLTFIGRGTTDLDGVFQGNFS